MGKDALDVTVPLADVYIKPDMSGMNMMSFDSMSIAECLHRGYIAAQSQGEKLKAIKEKVGSQHTTHLSNVPAINVNDNKVVIGRVEYDGIDERIASYFRKKSIIADSGLYSSSEIEEEMAVMYGSGLFDQVSYSLYGDKEPFTLTFHCKRGPIHQFGFGLHFDSKTMLSAAINVGFNRRKLSGFKADFTLFVGNNPSATIDMKYAFLNGPSIGIRLHTRYQNLISQSAQQAITSIINSEDQNKSVWYNHAEIYAITHSWRDGFAKLGFEYHSTPYEQTVYYYRDNDNPFENPYYKERTWVGNRITRSRNWNVFTFGPYLELVYDNTDDSYFPTKGIDMGIKYSFYIYQSYKLKLDIDDTDSLFTEKQHLESSPDSPKQVTDETFDYYIAHDLSHNLNLHIKKVFALHPRIALIPSLWGNLNFDNNSNQVNQNSNNKNLHSLETLILIDIGIYSEECLILLGNIIKHQRCGLKTLILSQNNLGHSNPVNLDCFNDLKDMKYLLQCIKENKSINELMLLSCQLGNNIIDDFYQMLKVNKSIEHLVLYNNNINQQIPFLKLLSLFSDLPENNGEINNYLKVLDLSKNN